ncbi:MAG: VanZ family protein [Anaerolineae bacterium]
MDAQRLRRAWASPVGRWLPVLLWMAGIFYFSSRPDPLAFVGRPSADRDALGRAAHVLEYAGLAFWLQRALAREEQGAKAYRWAGLLSVAYAVSDEAHQMWVPGREASLGDVALDALGTAAALALLWMWEKRSAVSQKRSPCP